MYDKLKHMTEKPLFIADAMLGSLAKWLRILGFDTLYFKEIDDNELIRIARQEDRMLLTRDAGLVKRKTIDSYILITSNEVSEQLKEVLRIVCSKQYAVSSKQCAAGTEESAYCLLPTAYFFSRCTECNGLLMPVDKESVMDAIPEHIFLSGDSFFKCKKCGKVYWNGSHKKMMDAKVEEVLKHIDKKPA
jgi:uncharacterized protein with PIN domain